MKQHKALHCENCNEITVATRTWFLGTSKWRCGQCGGTKVVDNDPIANDLLREAKILRGKNDVGAVKRLREIVTQYPETDAAKAAEKLLSKLGVQKDAPKIGSPKIVDAEVIPSKQSLIPKMLKRLGKPRESGDAK